MPLSTTHVTRGRVVAECVARTYVWARVQSCGLCPEDFVSDRVGFSNANSVVEAHGRAAVLLDRLASYGRPVGLRPYA
eukprot:2245317-Prymnesium_polylepis.1